MWYLLIVNNENLKLSSSQIYSTTNLQNWSLSSISFPKTTSIDSNICSADLGCCHISPNKEYSSHAIFIWYQKALNAWTLVISFLIPHSVASEHRWLVKATRWIGCRVSGMSRAGGRDAAIAMRDCGIFTTSQTRPVCKHCFSALPIDKTSSVEAQIGLLGHRFGSSSYWVWDQSERSLGVGFRSANAALEVLRESRSG